MIKIALCDDDIDFFENIKTAVCHEYKLIHEIDEDLEFKYYQSGNDLINRYELDGIDVVFMDIEIGNESGFDVAKELLKVDKNLLVIYMSNHEHYIYEAFVCRPMGFVRKQHMERDLVSAMTEVVEYLRKRKKKIMVKNNSKNIEVLLSNVRAIEVYDHKIIIQFKNNSITVKDKMSRFEDELINAGFVKIGRGTIVNLQYVKTIHGKQVDLYGNLKFSISEDRVKEVTNQWLRFQMIL